MRRTHQRRVYSPGEYRLESYCFHCAFHLIVFSILWPCKSKKQTRLLRVEVHQRRDELSRGEASRGGSSSEVCLEARLLARIRLVAFHERLHQLWIELGELPTASVKA